MAGAPLEKTRTPGIFRRGASLTRGATMSDDAKSKAIESAVRRQLGAGAQVEVEGADVFVHLPGESHVVRYTLSHQSWEILEAAINRGVPLEPDTRLELVPPAGADQ